MIQKEYQPAIQDALKQCIQFFNDRLEAVYVAGSVATGEAWPGESDVDWFMFLREEPKPEDKSWCKGKETVLVSRYPAAREFHLNLYSTEFLKNEKMLMKFILRYNSLCLLGDKHLDAIEAAGAAIPKPTKQLAKNRLGWVKQCADGLASRKLPDDLFQGAIPSDFSRLSAEHFLASRKLVRNFVLLEGAHLLMLTGNFQSFQQKDVLRKLAVIYPQWSELLDTAAGILKDPFAAKITPETVRKRVLPFVKWVIEQTEKA